MWSFVTSRWNKSNTDPVKSETESPPSPPSIEEYVGEEKWINPEKYFGKEVEYLEYSTNFERWINYWVAADRYLKDSYVERYMECKLQVKICPRTPFFDPYFPVARIIYGVSWQTSDNDGDKRWDKLFQSEVSGFPSSYTGSFQEVYIKAEEEDIPWIITQVGEIVTGEKIDGEKMYTSLKYPRSALIADHWYFPIHYREKIQDCHKLLETLNDLHKRIFELFKEDINFYGVSILTLSKERELFDLTEWDKINNVKGNVENGVE